MDEAFIQRLQAAFRIEAEEHLQAMSAGLLDVERQVSAGAAGAEMAGLVEGIFREAHSLKGAARAVNFQDVETICQALEDIFAGWKSGTPPAADGFDVLHQALDAIEKILKEGFDATTPVFTQTQLAGIVARIRGAKSSPAGSPLAPPPTAHQNGMTAPPVAKADVPVLPEVLPPPARPQAEPSPGTASPAANVPAAPSEPTSTAPVSAPAGETVRIASAKLDALLLQAEEMVVLKQSARQRLYDLRELESQLAAWRREWGKAADEMAAQFARAQLPHLNELFSSADSL